MRQCRLFAVACAGIVISGLAGCLPTQTIVVRFEDLRTDFYALEASLYDGSWVKFNWNDMTITISQRKAKKPVTLGGFKSTGSARSALSSQRSAAASRTDNSHKSPKVDLSKLEMTDTIVTVWRRRQGRLMKIKEMKEAGVIGESNVGLLARPDGKSLLALPDEQRNIVQAENTDRTIFFEEVLRQRKLPREKLEDVGRLFAEVQRDFASPGYWLQADNGAWYQLK